jgi:hypothetical protein
MLGVEYRVLDLEDIYIGLAAFCFWTLVLETSMIGEYTEVSGLSLRFVHQICQ